MEQGVSSAAFVIPADLTADTGPWPAPGPIRYGSEAHKRLFCKTLLDTFNPYRPAVLDWPKLGPSVLIATALIVAIRTAKWSSRPPEDCGGADIDHELDQEVRFATRVTFRVMHELLSKHEGLFPQKRTPMWEPTDEGVPK